MLARGERPITTSVDLAHKHDMASGEELNLGIPLLTSAKLQERIRCSMDADHVQLLGGILRQDVSHLRGHGMSDDDDIRTDNHAQTHGNHADSDTALVCQGSARDSRTESVSNSHANSETYQHTTSEVSHISSAFSSQEYSAHALHTTSLHMNSSVHTSLRGLRSGLGLGAMYGTIGALSAAAVLHLGVIKPHNLASVPGNKIALDESQEDAAQRRGEEGAEHASGTDGYAPGGDAKARAPALVRSVTDQQTHDVLRDRNDDKPSESSFQDVGAKDAGEHIGRMHAADARSSHGISGSGIGDEEKKLSAAKNHVHEQDMGDVKSKPDATTGTGPCSPAPHDTVKHSPPASKSPARSPEPPTADLQATVVGSPMATASMSNEAPLELQELQPQPQPQQGQAASGHVAKTPSVVADAPQQEGSSQKSASKRKKKGGNSSKGSK